MHVIKVINSVETWWVCRATNLQAGEKYCRFPSETNEHKSACKTLTILFIQTLQMTVREFVVAQCNRGPFRD